MIINLNINKSWYINYVRSWVPCEGPQRLRCWMAVLNFDWSTWQADDQEIAIAETVSVHLAYCRIIHNVIMRLSVYLKLYSLFQVFARTHTLMYILYKPRSNSACQTLNTAKNIIPKLFFVWSSRSAFMCEDIHFNFRNSFIQLKSFK